jgi:DNA-binding transcriptional ArsR family regulator
MTGEHLDAVFSALADPTRRHLLERLASRGAATPTELAAELPITRQAVAKHLTSLDRAGLVTLDRQGRQARYHATSAPLTEVVAWLATVGTEWDHRLGRLGELLEDEQR